MTPDDLLARTLALSDALGGQDGLQALGPGGLSLCRLSSTTPLDAMVYQPIVCLVLQGRKELRWGDTVASFGPMQMLLVGVDLALDARVTEASRRAPYVSLSIAPDLAMLREIAAGSPAPPSADDAAGPAIAEADAAILDAMGRLVGLLDRPRAHAAIEPLIRREIHWWLLESAQGPLLRRLILADGHASRVSRAVAAIRADLAAPLRVTDLARVAAMSPSAFHAHFKAATATSPIQFQKRLRLIEARRLLQAGSASVAGAAFAVGYESPTQFSRDYARAFGHPPKLDRGAPLAVAAE